MTLILFIYIFNFLRFSVVIIIKSYCMKPSILYKIHENDDCNDLLKITRYLYANDYDIRPLNVIERNFPEHINQVPTISINDSLIVGLNNIVIYYETLLNIPQLLNKANRFSNSNPNYSISNVATHKNIMF